MATITRDTLVEMGTMATITRVTLVEMGTMEELFPGLIPVRINLEKILMEDKYF